MAVMLLQEKIQSKQNTFNIIHKILAMHIIRKYSETSDKLTLYFTQIKYLISSAEAKKFLKSMYFFLAFSVTQLDERIFVKYEFSDNYK